MGQLCAKRHLVDSPQSVPWAWEWARELASTTQRVLLGCHGSKWRAVIQGAGRREQARRGMAGAQWGGGQVGWPAASGGGPAMQGTLLRPGNWVSCRVWTGRCERLSVLTGPCCPRAELVVGQKTNELFWPLGARRHEGCASTRGSLTNISRSFTLLILRFYHSQTPMSRCLVYRWKSK